jgi:hypothetical protein
MGKEYSIFLHIFYERAYLISYAPVDYLEVQRFRSRFRWDSLYGNYSQVLDLLFLFVIQANGGYPRRAPLADAYYALILRAISIMALFNVLETLTMNADGTA